MSWAGFYLGGHGGYAWKDNDFSKVLNFNTVAQAYGIKSQGWLAGGHGGYNWQYGRVVTGLEIDFSFSGLNGNSATVVAPNGFPGFTDTASLADRVKYLATSRARLGWFARRDRSALRDRRPCMGAIGAISTDGDGGSRDSR